MSSPSSLSPSAMSDTPAPGSSVAGKGGGFRSELAAMFAVMMGLDVGGSGSGASGKRGRADRGTPAGGCRHYNNTHTGHWGVVSETSYLQQYRLNYSIFLFMAENL